MKAISFACILSYFAQLQYSSAQDAQHSAQIPLDTLSNRAARRVAIIGAGSAGASTAYYLSQHAKHFDISLQITVYERNKYIGGRSTTVSAYDDPTQPVELGASIFVEVNQHLVNATKALNLTVTDSASRSTEQIARRLKASADYCVTSPMPANCSRTVIGNESPRQVLGIWDGVSFVLTQPIAGDTRWENWWSTAKLFWRYWLAPLKAQSLMRNTVDKFLKMYTAPHFPWREGLTQASQSVGLEAVTAATGSQFLKENGISDLFAREVVQASTRVNYAQNLPGIHGLETMVCLAAGQAMSVKGGNWQIFEGMLNVSGADVRLGSKVTNLIKLDNGSYVVGTDEPDKEKDTAPHDVVIIAAPFHQTGLDISPQPRHTPDDIPYVQLFVTLFSSPHRLAPSAFNLDEDEEVPNVILSTLPPHEHPGANPDPNIRVGTPGFFSVSQVGVGLSPNATGEGVPRAENLYKIFSPHPVPDKELLRLIGQQSSKWRSDRGESDLEDNPITWIYRKAWLSYPFLYPRVTFEDQELDDDLWYTSGIESFISTMETSSLMGANVARLIADKWMDKTAGTNVESEVAETLGSPIGDEL